MWVVVNAPTKRLKTKNLANARFFYARWYCRMDRRVKAKPPPGKTDIAGAQAKSTLLPRPRLLYSHYAVEVSVVQVALHVLYRPREPVLPENGRLEMAASAHGFATLKPSLITLSRITT